MRSAPIAQPTDQAARDLVSRSGLDLTLFVEAGAGSGKTRQLVERIANLAVRGDTRLSEIAAITFTDAAATELRTRIREELEGRVVADDLTEDQHDHCRRALVELDLAAISTLHGFATRILTEFAIAAGLPPQIRVLDEVSSQLAQEERWDRFVDSLYDDPANEALLVRAALVGVVLEERYSGQTTMKDVAVELSQNWDRLGPLESGDAPVIGELDFSAFDATIRTLVSLPARCSDPTDKFAVHLSRLLPHMIRIAGLSDPDRKLAELSAATPWGVGQGGRDAAWGCDIQEVKAFIREANDAAAEVRNRAVDDVLRHLLVLVANEVTSAARARRRDGGLEFHDLLVIARDTLRHDPAVRAVLHDRYTRVLLDEFQDTDPIQIDLTMLIATSISGETPGPWSELDVDPGRLFFVGDPKQSIYRFRRADIELFLSARDRFGVDVPTQHLTTNFRTLAPILDWVNGLFAELMPAELAGQQPKYEPLAPWRVAQPEHDHRPLLLGGPHGDPRVKAGVLRQAEAHDVARLLDDLRARPEQWPVKDERTGSWRPGSLSDVVILIPTRTSLPYLRSALEQFRVPYRLATGTLVYDTQEVRDCLAALRAIDDPTDSLSLVAALRSPLYACSDVDLFTFRSAGGDWDIRREPPAEVPGGHPVRDALTHLRGLWSQRWWLSPAELLDRILVDRQAMLLAFGDPRHAEVWRRLRFLLDQARYFEETGGVGLRDFLGWTELQGADGARVHEPLLPETDDDAVRIMTIHGSKGLEFPITVLSGMTTKTMTARSGVSVLWGASGPPEVKLRKGTATARHEPRADIEAEMDAHERLRLLYVAATRARDHLVVSCHHKAGPTSTQTYAGRMWSYFAEHRELCRDLEESEPIASQPIAIQRAEVIDDREEWLAARDRVLAPQRLPLVISATTVARSAEPSALDASALDAAALDTDDDHADSAEGIGLPPRRRGRAGTAIGRAVHATLQVLDLRDPQDVELQAGRQCGIESIPEHVDLVIALVRSALGSDAVTGAAHRPHHKEVYVAAPVGGRVIEGYVDLLVETPDGLIVIDYKTDSIRSEADIDAKLASYELQGAAYAVALEVATDQPVTECRFVFCRPHDSIERTVVDLPGAMARVRTLLATRQPVGDVYRRRGG